MIWLLKPKDIKTLIIKKGIFEDRLKKTRKKIEKVKANASKKNALPYSGDWIPDDELKKKLRPLEKVKKKLETEYKKLSRIIAKERILVPARAR